MPQRSLPDVREAIAAETASLEAIVPGSDARATGQVTMIENTVDPATGMVTVRATMPNENELLWPGTLVNTALTLRSRGGGHRSGGGGAGQPGRHIRVRGQGRRRRPSGRSRSSGRVDGVTVLESGLEEGDVVVTDGQLLLSNGHQGDDPQRQGRILT